MRITLIGMSNIGKTHWSKRLEDEAGFKRLDCDALYRAKLRLLLDEQGCECTQSGVTKWLGYPYDPQYAENSKILMACEREALKQVIVMLNSSSPKENIVIETGGSVIYTGADIIQALKSLTRIIHLAASEQFQQVMFTRYLAYPKPIIWGDNTFTKAVSQTNQEALAMCYPQLLASREKRYTEMAGVTIPYEEHRKDTADLSLMGVTGQS